MSEFPDKALNKTLDEFISYPCMQAAVKFLTNNSAAIDAALTTLITTEIPAFSQTSNPEILPALSRHARFHTQEILRLLANGAPGSFAFVGDYARHCAEQRFPLEDILHAYRCTHKIFSPWLRHALLSSLANKDDAASAIATVADFTIAYTDAISTVATSAYLSHIRFIAEVAGDQRAELLSILLRGCDESDGRVAKLLRDAGFLDQRLSFCVVLARSVNPVEMLNPARANRLADAIDQALLEFLPRHLLDIRENRVVIVFCAPRRLSGWTVPTVALAQRVKAVLGTLGNSVLVGISNDVPSTSQIPGALREATLALNLSDVTQRVLQFADIPVQHLLIHLAGEEFQRVLPAWHSTLMQSNAKQNGALLTTLRSYANTNMNALKTAQELAIHPNTLYARLQKICEITGLDAKEFHALNALLIIAQWTKPNSSPQ
jgi:hypothetical protein